MAKIVWAPVLKTGAELKDMGDQIISSYGTMKQHMHLWCVCAAIHAVKTGDFTEIPRVIDKLEGMKQNAMRMWFVEQKDKKLPLKWVLKNKETKEEAHFEWVKERAEASKSAYEAAPDAVVAQFLAKPFWKFDKEKALFEGFDLKAELAKLLAKATKIASDTEKKDNPKTKLDGLDDLVALVQGGKAAAHKAGQAIQ